MRDMVIDNPLKKSQEIGKFKNQILQRTGMQIIFIIDPVAPVKMTESPGLGVVIQLFDSSGMKVIISLLGQNTYVIALKHEAIG